MFCRLIQPALLSRKRLGQAVAILTPPFLRRGEGWDPHTLQFSPSAACPGDPAGFHPRVLTARQSPCHSAPINMDFETPRTRGFPRISTDLSGTSQEAHSPSRLLHVPNGCQPSSELKASWEGLPGPVTLHSLSAESPVAHTHIHHPGHPSYSIS